MTLIATPDIFKSKANLQENLERNRQIIKPTPWGEEILHPKELPVGFRDVVTNHPLRTKFAQIEKTATGWKVK